MEYAIIHDKGHIPIGKRSVVSEGTKFVVGKPFPVPGAIPQREGPVMELMGGVLSVIIQYPGLKESEIQAFNKGFMRYVYLESDQFPPVATWVFPFPNPHGPVEPTFNARLVDPVDIAEYVDVSNGVKNAVYFFLLDGSILKAIKALGLHPEAIEMFHNTIRKQLAVEYSNAEFVANLGGLFTRTVQEIYALGTEFAFDPR